jgi:alkanesulfonate monooxygenase SsuD/methylene tetrahydromethanopterin reductase-like flavin-dependent oxidoreductase (luciferase family)
LPDALRPVRPRPRPHHRRQRCRPSFRNSLELAQHAERLGYRRFWLAEHHGMPGIASAATAVLIGHIAGGTRSIRVGAGGIMLPNHSPLVIAEQFGTLEALYPAASTSGWAARRAPTSPRRARCAATSRPTRTVPAGRRRTDGLPVRRAAPGGARGAGQGAKVPVWILGSSLFGAQLAAMLGLPYAFASHFAPAQMQQAIEIYRATFKPSGSSPSRT